MADGRPILIVDRDPALRSILAEQLALHQEFAVSQAVNVAEAAELLARKPSRFDAIILDWVPIEGADLCQALRRQGCKVPILLLIGNDAECVDADRAAGIAAGASECIGKPFRIGELLARLRAQLRQFDNSDDAALRIAGFVFHPAGKSLEAPATGQRLRLTEKESAILKFLHRADGQPVARRVLLDEVWGYNANVTTHTLETHIYRLRQKIEIDPTNATRLLTEAGGYRLRLDE